MLKGECWGVDPYNTPSMIPIYTPVMVPIFTPSLPLRDSSSTKVSATGFMVFRVWAEVMLG